MKALLEKDPGPQGPGRYLEERTMPKLSPGDRAPAFKLRDQHDRLVTLAGFKGRKLLIYFYPRASTPGCTKQSCAVSEALPRLGKLSIAAVGISPDTPDRQRKFDEKHNLGFPLLSDADRAVARKYGAWGLKTSFGKQQEGILRSSFLVDESGKIVQAWYKVKPDETVPKALEAARA